LTSPGALIKVKLGASTVIYKVVTAVRFPEVPVIVTIVVPGAAALLAVTVSVLVLVEGLGESVAVTPLGRSETAKFTLPVNPN